VNPTTHHSSVLPLRVAIAAALIGALGGCSSDPAVADGDDNFNPQPWNDPAARPGTAGSGALDAMLRDGAGARTDSFGTTAGEAYSAGLRLVLQGNRVQARAALKTAANRDPEHLEARYQLARLQYDDRELAEAKKTLEEVLAIARRTSRPHVGAHLYLGRVLRGEGKLDDAIAEWEKGAGLTEFNAELYAMLAVGYVERGDATKAMERLDAILKVEPSNPFALKHYALLLLQATVRDADRAVHYLSLYVDHPEARNDVDAPRLRTYLQQAQLEIERDALVEQSLRRRDPSSDPKTFIAMGRLVEVWTDAAGIEHTRPVAGAEIAYTAGEKPETVFTTRQGYFFLANVMGDRERIRSVSGWFFNETRTRDLRQSNGEPLFRIPTAVAATRVVDLGEIRVIRPADGRASVKLDRQVPGAGESIGSYGRHTAFLDSFLVSRWRQLVQDDLDRLSGSQR
jgi:tetratricopeptide (TPR) repeat protein